MAGLYEGLSKAAWVYSRHLASYLDTPFGHALISAALTQVRAGKVPPYRRQGFFSALVESGLRREEWVHEMVLAGQCVSEIGLVASNLLDLQAPPEIVARALCQLNVPWSVILMFGRKTFGEGTPPSAWPRDVLKVILATHADKEVRLGVIQALEPPSSSVEEVGETPVPSAVEVEAPAPVAPEATTASPATAAPAGEARPPRGWAKSMMRRLVG